MRGRFERATAVCLEALIFSWFLFLKWKDRSEKRCCRTFNLLIQNYEKSKKKTSESPVVVAIGSRTQLFSFFFSFCSPSLLLDAMLANPLPSQVPNPGYHPSPLSPHPIIPSQSQNSPQEQPGHQPSSAVSSFPSSYPPGARFDHQDAHIPMPVHHHNNPTVPNHFYPSPHDGKEGSSHHYSSRSRGSQSDIGQRN